VSGWTRVARIETGAEDPVARRRGRTPMAAVFVHGGEWRRDPVTPQIKVNPASGCPVAVLADQRVITPDHWGFDGAILTGHLEIHRSVAEEVASFFDLARELHYPIERVVPASALAWNDPDLMAANHSSGFNYRTVAGKTMMSLHALGLAFDINPRVLPFLHVDNGTIVTEPPGAVYDPSHPAAIASGNPLVAHMESLGWTWGGNWTIEDHGIVDYQHFEKRLTSEERSQLLAHYGIRPDTLGSGDRPGISAATRRG